jgi:peptidoglycan/xylan/chitin deacetylase (PgdA/CDA1 family)
MKRTSKLVIGQGVSQLYRFFHFMHRSDTARVLMYHAVGTSISGDRAGLYNIAPSRFRQHMDVLCERSTRLISFSSVLTAPRHDKDAIAVTFDDGYADTLRVAAPILIERNIPFTVFVTPTYIRSGNQSYLTVGDLRELAALPGATIGAHGETHCRLPDCDDRSLENELTYSRIWLQDILGMSVETMSFPHGANDQRVRMATKKAGYTMAATSRFGACKPVQDFFSIPRTDIWAEDDVNIFRAKLAGDWDWMWWR